MLLQRLEDSLGDDSLGSDEFVKDLSGNSVGARLEDRLTRASAR